MKKQSYATYLLLAVLSFAAVDAKEIYTRKVVKKPGIEQLIPAGEPKEIAPGVWTIQIGNMKDEVRYTDFADREMNAQELGKFEKKNFPFDANVIRYTLEKGNLGVRLPAPKEEEIFGFGLQLDGIKKRNRILDLKVDHWGGGAGPTHAPVPFYLSSKGYGVFINTARPLRVYSQVGNRKDAPQFPPTVDRNPPADEPQPGGWDAQPLGDAVEIQSEGEGMELVIFAGDSMQDIVAKYNLYNGGGAMPPLWGLGFWHRTPATFNEKETMDEVAEFEKRGIPLDVIGLEPGWMSKSYPCTFEWQKKRFPNPASFTKNLLNKGIRLNLWENPYVSPHARIYDEIKPFTGSHTVWLGIAPDFTTKEARDIYGGQHKKDHIDIGISGYKTDETDGFDEWLWPDHAEFPSGIPGDVMRQIYGLTMQKLYQEELFRKNNKRSYGLVRSSNGAASGYPNALYSDAYEHKQFITGVSSSSLCGVLWAPEIRSAGNSMEWLCRMQTSVFSPFAMLNAWASGTKPWSYEDMTDKVKDLIQLRMQLIPYLYTAFAQYNQKGIPPFRAMILEPGYKTREIISKGTLDDTLNPYEMNKTMEVTDQYMMGDSIMVAPYYEGKSKERDVNLPAGTDWYDFYTGELVGQNKTIKVQNDGKMPLFVKDGSLIPMLVDDTLMNTDQIPGKDVELRYYGKAPAQASLYEDDGQTFDYEKGAYRMRSYKVSGGDKPTLEESVTVDKANPLYGKATLKVMTNR